jgi:hypothetical protein
MDGRRTTGRRSRIRCLTSVVTAGDLVEGVSQDGLEHVERVGHATARPREVGDEGAPGQADETTGEHGRRDTLGDAGRTDRLGYAGDEPG